MDETDPAMILNRLASLGVNSFKWRPEPGPSINEFRLRCRDCDSVIRIRPGRYAIEALAIGIRAHESQHQIGGSVVPYTAPDYFSTLFPAFDRPGDPRLGARFPPVPPTPPAPPPDLLTAKDGPRALHEAEAILHLNWPVLRHKHGCHCLPCEERFRESYLAFVKDFEAQEGGDHNAVRK